MIDFKSTYHILQPWDGITTRYLLPLSKDKVMAVPRRASRNGLRPKTYPKTYLIRTKV